MAGGLLPKQLRRWYWLGCRGELGRCTNMCSSPTRGVSTTDSVFPLLAQANRRPTLVVFLDLEKAFELASPHAVLTALIEKDVRGKLLAWLRDYLLHRRSRARDRASTSWKMGRSRVASSAPSSSTS